jgi:short-subunit dehydrogenase
MKKKVFLDNVIILTGASVGIGRQLALQLAGQGALLALASRNTKKLEEVAEQCSELGGKALAIPTDVAKQSQCRNLVQRTAEKYGRIDTLINNAGIGMAAKFDGLPDLTIFEKIVQVNFFGSVYCTHYALPFLKQTSGRIVGISSLRGKFPSATADGYGPSKHAMAGFFDSLRLELTDSGVSVTMIYPGWVSTGISSRALGVDGRPTGKLSYHEEGAMPCEKCADLIIRAAARRKREVIMTFQGKAGLWMRLVAPGAVDRIAKKGTGHVSILQEQNGKNL